MKSFAAGAFALFLAVFGPDLSGRLLNRIASFGMGPEQRALTAHWTRETFDAWVSAGGWERIRAADGINTWIVSPLCQLAAGVVVGNFSTARPEAVAAGIGVLAGLATIRGSGWFEFDGVIVAAVYAVLGWHGARVGVQVRRRRHAGPP